jgi:MoaA/NifB/PqqE/SkfB family radical SAM enzyme
MKTFLVEISKGRFKIHGLVQEVGQDILVSIWGGTRPHIGAVGIAIPRPSLKNPKEWSATSSNFTFIGHKEDALVKKDFKKAGCSIEKKCCGDRRCSLG